MDSFDNADADAAADEAERDALEALRDTELAQDESERVFVSLATTPALRVHLTDVFNSSHMSSSTNLSSLSVKSTKTLILPKWMNAYTPAENEPNAFDASKQPEELSEPEDEEQDVHKIERDSKRQIEEALEKDMFGIKHSRISEIFQRDKESSESDHDDDDAPLFSDSDSDSYPNSLAKRKLDSSLGERIVIPRIKSLDPARNLLDAPPQKKRAYKPISMSENEASDNDSDADHSRKVHESDFYGDRKVTAVEMGLGPQSFAKKRDKKIVEKDPKAMVQFDQDGEPVFMYPDSSDDENASDRHSKSDPDGDLPMNDSTAQEVNAQPNSPNTNASVHKPRNRNADNRTDIPRIFREDYEDLTESFTLPTGGRRRAPSKAETEARRERELRAIALKLKQEIEEASLFHRIEEKSSSVNESRTVHSAINYMLMPCDGRTWRTAVDSKGRRIYFPIKRRKVSRIPDDSDARKETESGRTIELLGESIHVLLRRGITASSRSPSKRTRLEPLTMAHNGQKEWIKKFPDPYHRPDKKILLLSGPAGLGKTTLAHIVGRHAGYNVIEINASDDRTGDSLRNKLLGAIESQSVTTKKPNLVIIDEIDGASSAAGDDSFMELLVSLMNGTWRTVRLMQITASKKLASKNHILLRPIICICNDQYAPVLRPLRLIAQTFTFRPPPHRILASRLTLICRNENLTTDLRTLMALCELTDGDIRSCLNTCQFFKRLGKLRLNVDLLKRYDVGRKDMTRSLFTVWEDLFMILGAKRRKNGVAGVSGGGDGGKDKDANRYIHRLLSLIAASGETGKILEGCFENYLRMNIVDAWDGGAATATPSDPSTKKKGGKIEQALDWLCFHDKIERFIVKDRDFELFKYQPFVVVNFHRLFAAVGRPQIEFPRGEYESFVKKRVNDNIVSSFVKGLSPCEYGTWSSKRRVTLELVSPFLAVLAPDFRAVNINLLKPDEAKVLSRLVEVMVSFGIKYVQEKGEDGHYLFKLLPAIDKLVVGNESASTEAVSFQQLQISNPVKQLIGNQVEMEAIRQANVSSKERGRKAAGSRPNLFKKMIEGDKVVASEDSNAVGSSQKRLEAPVTQTVIVPKIVAPAKLETVAKDFFGRPIIIIEDDGDEDVENNAGCESGAGKVIKKKSNATASKRNEPTVSFRYNEGFSNAVRTPMKISDFIAAK
ncbi:hypothetical protein BJ741DRAFT_661907 [Chytriomyces cf. hyalinus JEL632]|nr:hypothetical protein BJ741DRAFT_661907 [Chytriomyces cf. hyalinus JEL632]